MKLIILSAILFLSGCVIGPLEIIHKEGNWPKVHVNTGYEACKLRFKGGLSPDEVYYMCKWDIEI